LRLQLTGFKLGFLSFYCTKKEIFKRSPKSWWKDHHNASSDRVVLNPHSEDVEMFITVWWMYEWEKRDTDLFPLKSRGKVSWGSGAKLQLHKPKSQEIRRIWEREKGLFSLLLLLCNIALVSLAHSVSLYCSIQICELNLENHLVLTWFNLTWKINLVSIPCVQENKIVASLEICAKYLKL